ncbi:DUF4767 domain-containing protein [Streptococcus caprae]|uniref:DUF4767 domain-containing protein n=1 Tax=Streptococcus caprae TaxID=1640501 RepID=A0ABV8CX35_9STRE
MNKGLSFGLVAVSVLSLVACSGKREKEVKQEKTTTVTTMSSQTTTTTTASQPGVWSADKGRQLHDYIINTWGPALGQGYVEYTPTSPGNFYGVSVPNGLMGHSLSMVPDFSGLTPKLVWSADGNHQPGETALVAVFSDIETTVYPSSHLYFFTYQDGVGKVWITEQNQGNSENQLYFRETQNVDLRNFYVGLVGGGTGQTSATTQATPSSSQTALTSDQAGRWAAAHKASEYGAPYTREDFAYRVTPADQSSDGLVAIQVLENHNSENMKCVGAASGVSSSSSFYRINAKGELEKMDATSGVYQIVSQTYFE